VLPRALTLGVYVEALAAAGVDDGEPWDAAAADDATCYAVLSALADADVPRRGFRATVRAKAAEAWGRMEAERARALAAAARLRAEAEEALGEEVPPHPPPARHRLLRVLGTLPPVERAAALAEPLALSLVFGEMGAVQRQADEADEAVRKITENVLNGRSN